MKKRVKEVKGEDKPSWSSSQFPTHCRGWDEEQVCDGVLERDGDESSDRDKHAHKPANHVAGLGSKEEGHADEVVLGSAGGGWNNA